MLMTPEFATQITRKLMPDEELIAAVLNRPRGIFTCNILSLAEFHYFIQGTRQSLPSVNFSLLEQWLRETIGDRFLADQIAEIEAQDVCFIDKCKLTIPVVESRLLEAYSILELEKQD
ncbi:hypothetical protein [Shewanella pealeana]|uniref:Uncharacterized protein n=1 Tax=Shewanella pealeana (strain ATCC 700345 / ANG-SQ1) TaxID=398579 RepID=A8GZ53_SHEPA|nr:hypothetical protein [Shewanella pealeana]ABV85590.1 hypothetical protein Spea_0262 [Shewanella pealeana ATCC 700345]